MKTKGMGKVLALVMLLACMVFGIHPQVYAQENIGVQTEPPVLPYSDEGISVYDISPPDRDTVYVNNQSNLLPWIFFHYLWQYCAEDFFADCTVYQPPYQGYCSTGRMFWLSYKKFINHLH